MNMKNKCIVIISFVALLCITCNDNKSQSPVQSQSEINTSDAAVRLVKKGLNYPWEIIWGKDNHIWMTERDGKISSIDPATGNTIFSFTINEVESRNEGGLLGMALHPDFQHNGLLYVVYNYSKGDKHLEKLMRYTYVNNTLVRPVVLLDGIVGSTNHNGSRLWITNGNPQGLVMVNNIMYASEHGPSEEDEVNIIEKGRNYGWPNVEGPCNGDEITFCKSHNVKEPIWSSGNNTLAVCGLDYYNNNRISQWKNSLIMMTLKNSSIRQLQLSNDGKSIINTKTYFENKWGRLRDLCISPDGKVYVCTSNGGNSDVIVEISKL